MLASGEKKYDHIEKSLFRYETEKRRASVVRQPGDIVYADNGVIKVGVDLNRGGSIAHLSVTGGSDKDNVINAHDMGREVQLSFYSGPDFYNPPTAAYPNGACDKLFGHQEWPWNPIGAGDIDGNRGKILNFTKNGDDSGWSMLTKPLQWACHNVPCECEFEQVVSTTDVPGKTGVKLVSTLHNHRSDTTLYPAHSQELPAVYSNGPFYRLITYNGTAPWTGDATAEYITGFRGPGAKGGAWIPGTFTPTEKWAALVNEEGWGLGVVNHEVDVFLGGFSGTKGSGSSSSPNTGYIAPVASVQLPYNTSYTFTSYLVLGDVATIRAFAKQTRPT